MFTGILKCKECEHSLSIDENVNKKNNSHCTCCNLYKRKEKYEQCTQHRLNYNIIEKELLDILRNICTSFLEDYEECKGIIEEFLKLKKPTRNVIARLVNRVEVSESHELDVYFNFKEISIVNNIKFF